MKMKSSISLVSMMCLGCLMKPTVEARLIKVMADGPEEEVSSTWERFEPHFEAARPADRVRHFKTNSELLSTLLKIGDEDTLRHHESLEDHEDFIEKRSGNNLLINDALGVQDERTKKYNKARVILGKRAGQEQLLQDFVRQLYQARKQMGNRLPVPQRNSGY